MHFEGTKIFHRHLVAFALAIGAASAHAAIDTPQGNADAPRWLLLDLLAEDPAPAFASRFGNAVDIAGDLLVIGAPHFLVDNVDAGAAHVYRRVGGAWELETTLTATVPQHGASFGFSVSVAATPEREVIVIGEAARDFGANADRGELWIYERVGGDWVNVARFSDQGSIALGYAIDTDGTNLIAGAPSTNAFYGATFVYHRDATAGTWAFDHTAQPASSDAVAGYYGISVALAGDLALTGAMAARVGNDAVGAAEISNLFADGPLAAPVVLHAQEAAPGDEFGRAVAASGSRFVVGAPGAEDASEPSNSGVVHVFRRSNGQVHFEARLTSILPQENARFGASVAISDDLAIIGEPSRTVYFLGTEFAAAGAVALFRRDDWSVWHDEGGFYNLGVNEGFGEAVAIDGAHAIGGMPRHAAGAARYIERDTIFFGSFQDMAPE